MLHEKYLPILLVLFVCCQLKTLAQNSAPKNLIMGAPEKNNFSPERLSHIDKVVQSYIDSGWINGAIALVARNGEIVYYKGMGYNDIEKKEPMKKTPSFVLHRKQKPSLVLL